MVIHTILYHPAFVKRFQKLAQPWREQAIKTERLFRINPLHPSLRLHSLKGLSDGLWSLSVNRSVRIIFKRMPNGDVVFVTIGKHDVYRLGLT